MARGKSFDMKKEFAGLDFHSLRLKERFIRSMETLIYPDVLNNRGNDTKHDLHRAA
ncbi:MAG: hypothetical protein LBB48_05115 [Treponema sp.]|jgi:hypothetical protein|nr:hypothetical protein [Treponema sp.]